MQKKNVIKYLLSGCVFVLVALLLVFVFTKEKHQISASKETNLSVNASQKQVVQGLFADFNKSDFEENPKPNEAFLVALATTSRTNSQDYEAQSAIFNAFNAEKNESNSSLANLPKPLSNSAQSPLQRVLDKDFKIGKSSHSQNLQTPLKETNATKSLEIKPFKAATQKPKLTIIIDDMATKAQVKELQNTGLRLTPSFFPADKNHPNTKNFAKEFKSFMLHLPLAAKNFKDEELLTLYPNDPQSKIDERLARVKKDFKNLVFINNHTGSLFTSDEAAMRRLFKALQKNEFKFIDSLTIGSSKGEKVAKEFGEKILVRDVFIDNINEVEAIEKELAKAVKLAHKNGYAIAIGHPHKNTFKALKRSKKMLESVEVLYIDELYEFVYGK